MRRVRRFEWAGRENGRGVSKEVSASGIESVVMCLLEDLVGGTML